MFICGRHMPGPSTWPAPVLHCSYGSERFDQNPIAATFLQDFSAINATLLSKVGFWDTLQNAIEFVDAILVPLTAPVC